MALANQTGNTMTSLKSVDNFLKQNELVRGDGLLIHMMDVDGLEIADYETIQTKCCLFQTPIVAGEIDLDELEALSNEVLIRIACMTHHGNVSPTNFRRLLGYYVPDIVSFFNYHNKVKDQLYMGVRRGDLSNQDVYDTLCVWWKNGINEVPSEIKEKDPFDIAYHHYKTFVDYFHDRDHKYMRAERFLFGFHDNIFALRVGPESQENLVGGILNRVHDGISDNHYAYVLKGSIVNITYLFDIKDVIRNPDGDYFVDLCLYSPWTAFSGHYFDIEGVNLNQLEMANRFRIPLGLNPS